MFAANMIEKEQQEVITLCLLMIKRHICSEHKVKYVDVFVIRQQPLLFSYIKQVRIFPFYK